MGMPPVLLSLTNINGHVYLTWASAEVGDGFYIERSDNNFSWTRLATVIDSTSYIDTTPLEDVTYYYRVVRFTSLEREPSNVLSINIPYIPPLNLRTTSDTNLKQLYSLLWAQVKDDAIVFPKSLDGFTIPHRDTFPSRYQYQQTSHKFAYVTLMTGNLINVSFNYTIEGLRVTFTNTSTYPASNWTWDFGDGTTSNEDNPVHTYTANGSYIVKLQAFDYTGTDTIDVNVEFLLSWTEFGSNQTGFNIEHSYDGTSWTILDTVDASVTNYRVSNIVHGIDVFRTNYFRIEAFNDEGSAFSNVAISTCGT